MHFLNFAESFSSVTHAHRKLHTSTFTERVTILYKGEISGSNPRRHVFDSAVTRVHRKSHNTPDMGVTILYKYEISDFSPHRRTFEHH